VGVGVGVIEKAKGDGWMDLKLFRYSKQAARHDPANYCRI